MAHYSIHEPFSRGPGPPWAATRPPPGPFEDGDDAYFAGGPDDLGDLILDMRDGGAWAEGLMDCGEGSQPPAGAGDAMQTLLALSRAQQAQDLEQQAQAAPAVRAALAHPGQASRGVLMHPGSAMVPVGGQGPLTCAAGLACGADSQWPPAPQPAAQLPFYGAPNNSTAPGGGAMPLPWFVSLPSMAPHAPPPLNFYPPDAGGSLSAAQLAAMQQGEGQHASGSGSVGFSDGTTLRMRSSLDSGSGSTLPTAAGRPCRAGAATVPLYGTPLGDFEESRDAPSDSSDVEDGGDRMDRQHSLTQVVPDASMFVPGATLPFFCGYYGSQAALTARLARHASLERFRLKKARRALAGGGRKIRYQARKVNADKRIRVKGRFVKADEAAAILAAEAHEMSTDQLSTEQLSTEQVSIDVTTE